MSEPLISCPFCWEEEFDLVGLKIHLFGGYCEPCMKLSMDRISFTFELTDEREGAR